MSPDSEIYHKEALADQRIKIAEQSGAYGLPATRMWTPWVSSAIGPSKPGGSSTLPIRA